MRSKSFRRFVPILDSGFIKCECISMSSLNFCVCVCKRFVCYSWMQSEEFLSNMASPFTEALQSDASAVFYLYQIVRNHAEICLRIFLDF